MFSLYSSTLVFIIWLFKQVEDQFQLATFLINLSGDLNGLLISLPLALLGVVGR